MRRLSLLLLSLCALPSLGSVARQTAPSILDDRAPFAIELPEIQSGVLTATSYTDIYIPPGAQITRLKLWVLQPYDLRFGYEMKAMLNSKALATVAQRKAGPCGNFLDIDLRQQRELQLKPQEKNLVEITGYEAESRLTYHASFVLLPGTSKSPRPVPLPEKAEIRFEQVPAFSDSPVPNDDRAAPLLTLTAPAAPPAAGNAASFSVRLAGFARDDSGIVTTIKVNGQTIASAPPPSKDDKKKKKDKNAVTIPPLERKLEFDQMFPVGPNTCALLIEARDPTGNRALAYVPIERGAPLAKTDFGGRKYAVIVGVSKYLHHEGDLHDLAYAHRDAESIRDWLRSDSGGGFKPDDIVCLTDGDATRAAVRDALARFLTTAGANDLIYLFMAGHGAPDPYDRSKLYFLLHDSKVTDLPNTALAMNEVGQFVNQQSKQARLIAFFDTCHSAGVNRQALNPAAPAGKSGAPDKRGVGTKKDKQAAPPANQPPTVTLSVGTPATSPAAQPGFNFYEGALFQKKGWTVISSSGLNEESQEDARWRDAAGNGHGVFTWALLEGAQQGKADANGDCRITAAELFEYIRKTVSGATSRAQNPQALPGGSSDLIVATVADAAACRNKVSK